MKKTLIALISTGGLSFLSVMSGNGDMVATLNAFSGFAMPQV